MMRQLLGFAFLLALASPARAGESCPVNTFYISSTSVGYRSTTPTGSIEFTKPGYQVVPWDAGQQLCFEGCYDLPRATIVARGYNSLYGPAATLVIVADEYVVLGPQGPPLSFEVVLQLNATIQIEGTASAGLGSQMIQVTASGVTSLALPVEVAPGTPFLIRAFASAVGGYLDGMGLAIVTIRFRGLPDSYAITSCQGYDQQTPARATTWGGVKALYR